MRVKDLVTIAYPPLAFSNFLGDDAPTTPAPMVSAPTVPPDGAVALGALSIGSLLVAGGLVVAGMYYWKTAPKVNGFWKGWGYYNGVASYLGASVYVLAGLGLGGASIVKAIRD